MERLRKTGGEIHSVKNLPIYAGFAVFLTLAAGVITSGGDVAFGLIVALILAVIVYTAVSILVNESGRGE